MTKVLARWCLLLVVGLACPLWAADPLGPEALKRKQQAQEKARTVAGELVTSVLDIQLRQLRENGLEALPIYDDIKAMRGNIDQLVDRQMSDVVALLVEAQLAPPDQRVEKLNQARGKVREVVVELMAERQRLYRRMHLAKLSAQIRQLIAMQVKVQETTRQLPERSQDERERMTLLAVEDQTDVGAVYGALLGVLKDVSTWGGQIGTNSTEGLKLLKAARTAEELDSAAAALTASRYVDAGGNQRAVLKALRLLLEKIEEAQGLPQGDAGQALSMVREVLRRQEQLKEQTQKADPNDVQVEERAEQQNALHKQIAELAQELPSSPQTDPLLEQAKAAALEAAAAILESNREEAVADQKKVIGNLAQLEQELQNRPDAPTERSAAQLADQLDRLADVARKLDQAMKVQEQASAQAPQNAAAARQTEQQVAQELAKAAAVPDLPANVAARIDEARDEVAQAQQALQNPAPLAAAERVAATTEAQEAIQQARDQVQAEMADLTRRQLAVKAGELARASEALERAAAAERRISAESDAAAQGDGLAAEAAGDLAREQANVGEVAQAVAEGVKQLSPDTAQMLGKAIESSKSAAQALTAAKQNPGQASKPNAAQAAEQSRSTAEQLEAAAAMLRQQTGQVAGELAKVSGQQLEKLAESQQAFDAALGAEGTEAQAFPDLQQALEQAARKVQQAQIEQSKAAGKEQLAQAMEANHRVQDLKAKQQAAEQAARMFAAGQSNSPTAAAQAQQAVAEAASQLAKESDGALRAALQAAAQSAEESARQMLLGNLSKANAARQATREQFDAAADAAQAKAAVAAEKPAGKPDLSAQHRASELASAAAQAAREAAPAAAQLLDETARKSEQAEKALAAEPSAAEPVQEEVAKALASSAQQLERALRSLANQEASRLTERAKLAEQVAARTGATAPEAASALRDAAEDARMADQPTSPDTTSPADKPPETPAAEPEADGATPDGATPAEVVAAREDFERGLERAAANLALREQRLRRDQEIATALARLAEEQQQARREIAKNAELLARTDRATEPAQPLPPSAEEQQAADALRAAAEQFAAAQRATGEGAAEVSGQREVANPPLRQALQKASELAAEASAAAQPMSADDLPLASASGEMLEQSPELGTNLIPNSPETTARQIAGQEALDRLAALAEMQQAQAALDEVAGRPLAKTSSEASPATPADEPDPARAAKDQAETLSRNSNSASAAKDSQATATQDAPGKESDETIAQRKFKEEPWFAKLPPALRNAMESNARRKPPRGYEERLQRYFRNAD